MEMRAIEDIATAQDLTPPITPLAAALHDGTLISHCSACFSPLPPNPTSPQKPNNNTPSILYCSPHCSSLDSPLHLSSSESHLRQSLPPTWDRSSDLRLALRLVQRLNLGGNYGAPDGFLGCCVERIGGLMTNRERLVFGAEDDVVERIRDGAKAMARTRVGEMCVGDEGFVLEEMVLCLVLTNAVEVQDGESGCSIGVAVYGTEFSWIDHSCSPNTCYQFLVGVESDGEVRRLRIAPAVKTGGVLDGLSPFSGGSGYGPRVVVRSIKGVSEGEEVTIAYTDLLQPKEIRQEELWLKYRFSCGCKRCSAEPMTYVDYALQALSVTNPDSQDTVLDQAFHNGNKIEQLMEMIDETITDYLSRGDPESCCKKLENLLSHGHISEEFIEAKSHGLTLHLLHHLSLNAYTTLASAYKVQASDLLALNHEGNRHLLMAFTMYKTSVAYSLLLAGEVHHLFMFESALVASAANFWINAGDSTLDFARGSLWDRFLKPGPADLKFSSFLNHKCTYCCLAFVPDPNMHLEEIKSRLFNCIASATQKVWSILASGSVFLELIPNPVDFSWLSSPESITALDYESHRLKFVMKKDGPVLEAEKCDDQVRIDIISLGVHCLWYGAILSSICYGSPVDMYYNRILASLQDSG